jgi:outer membrane protein assembly factor BamB
MGLLLANCSNKKGDIFLDFSDNLAVRKDNKILKFELGEPIKGEASFFRNGDDIFITSVTNNIIKFSLKDGAVLWKKTIGSVPQANLAFDGGRIYFTTFNNSLYILNYDTGKIEFIYDNADKKTITTCVKPIFYRKKEKNLMIVTFNDGEVVIFNANTRDILKRIPAEILKKTDVVLENNILRVDEKKIDLNTISK